MGKDLNTIRRTAEVGGVMGVVQEVQEIEVAGSLFEEGNLTETKAAATAEIAVKGHSTKTSPSNDNGNG